MKFLFTILGLALLIALGNYSLFTLSELNLDKEASLFLFKGISTDIFFLSIAFFFIFLFIGRFQKLRFLGGAIAGLFVAIEIICYSHLKISGSRFNWGVLHDLNFYSIKATLNVPILLSIFGSLMIIGGVFFLTSFLLKEKKAEINQNLFISLILVTAFLCYFSFYVTLEISEKDFESHPQAEAFLYRKNQLLETQNGLLLSFFRSIPISEKYPVTKFIEYTPEEKAFLQSLGLIAPQSQLTYVKPVFKNIIFIVLEGMANSYTHFYNKDIPKEASAFFDYLLSTFPRVDNMIAANCPTIKGIFSILMSRLPYSPDLSRKLKHSSLFEIFKQHTQGKTYFIRGCSKFYGGEHKIISDVFKADKLIAQEDFQKKLPKLPPSHWGYHDPTIFSETIRILELEKKNNVPVMIFAKTIDLHQPPYFCAVPKEKLPPSIRNHPSPIVPSLFSSDLSLRYFFAELNKRKLFTPDTLIVITSDHYPLPGWGHKELVKTNVPIQKETIPLIFVTRKPEYFKELQPKTFCSQIDIAPTICSLLGAMSPQSFLGNNLIDNVIKKTSRLSENENYLYVETASQTIAISLQKNEVSTTRALEKWKNNLFAPIQ